MADTLTTNYSLVKPEIGASNDTWGGKMNPNLDTIDATMKATADVATAALPKAGGVMTGRLDAKTSTLALVSLGTGNGSVALDCASGQYFVFTANGNSSFSFLNVPAAAFGVVVELTNGGAFTMTWPASVKWDKNAIPTLSAAGTDVLVFLTRDGGTTWRAVLSIKGTP